MSTDVLEFWFTLFNGTFNMMVNNWIMCIPIVIFIVFMARDFIMFIKKQVKGG